MLIRIHTGNSSDLVRLILWTLLQSLLIVTFLCGQAVSVERNENIARYKVEGYKHYRGLGTPVNFAKALQFYKMAAARGDAEAQFIAGGMMYKGQGTDPDPVGAFKLLLNAAEQGKVSHESMQIIGSMYLRGQGVPQNYNEAKKWLTLSAESNNLLALTDLAFIHYQGLDGKRDFKKALKYYTSAAMQGDSTSQLNVGIMHATGTGTPIDKAMGYAWYSISASQGNTTARIYRNELMAAMSWEELTRAQALSVEIYDRIEKVKEQQHWND